MALDTHTLAYVLLILAVAVLTFGFLYLYRRMSRMLAGEGSTTLEESVNFLRNSCAGYEEFQKEMEKYLHSVEERLRASTQGVATVRFNPFRGTGGGGNQSFATAFINEHGNGVILSTLYARDHMSVFAKPIDRYKSTFELTEEEKQALFAARDSLPLKR